MINILKRAIQINVNWISSTTSNVQHQPGWCDGSHIVSEGPPHTPPYWWRRISI